MKRTLTKDEVATRIRSLQERLDANWRDILRDAPALKALAGGQADKRLYLIYLIKTYHYTLHNARNQAAANRVSRRAGITGS